MCVCACSTRKGHEVFTKCKVGESVVGDQQIDGQGTEVSGLQTQQIKWLP